MEARLTPSWQDAEAALATPYFDAVREIILALQIASPGQWPARARLNQLAMQKGLRLAPAPMATDFATTPSPLRFVAPAESAQSAMQYETRITTTGEIPTRDNWHDLFNAIEWLTFPRTKSTISAMHAKLLLAGGSVEAEARGKPRDVLTMFDESGVIVASHDASLLQLIRDFRWHALFVVRRADVMRDMRFILVGHGLMEKALAPFIGMTAKAVLLHVNTNADLDMAAAWWLSKPANLQNARNLAPLPLLGIPSWDARNEDATFYDNAQYFRAGYTRDTKPA